MKTMKLWMIAAILFCGASVNAQTKEGYNTKDEIAVSVGAGSNSQIINAFSSIFSVLGEALITGMMTGGQYVGTTTYENEKDIPALSVEYFHHMDKVVSIGAIAAFNGTSSDMYCNFQRSDGSSITKEKVGYAHKYYFTLMPAAKFDWLRGKNFGLYSKLAVGATYYTEKEKQEVNGENREVHSDSGVRFNFQASLLGVEVGVEKFRGFVEFGAGEQGILLAGLRCKF